MTHYSEKAKTFLTIVVLLLLASGVKAQAYKQLTDLPTVFINTYNGNNITSKDTYTFARMIYIDGETSIQYDSLEIRGRGNSTWNMAKKPYRIKLQKKEKLLGKGFANARSWTLLANCADKSMLRNALTSELGSFLGIKFNPAAKFVDFYLNEKYLGTYQLSDQIDIRPHRVDIVEQEYKVKNLVTDITGGYLMEATANYDSNDPYFKTTKNVTVRIHNPSDSIIERQKNYISRYVQQFENALFSDVPARDPKGFAQFVDTTSLLNWYIANEIAANPDGFYSAYFYKEQQDSALYFGPLWDNDISYCNTTRKGDVTEKLMADVGYGDGAAKTWVTQLCKSAWFAKAVENRYRQAYNAGLSSFLLEKVDSLAELLQASQEENYKVWSINHRYYEEINLYSTYDEYIAELKQFIPAHNLYLLEAFSQTDDYIPNEQYYVRFSNKNSTETSIDVYTAATFEASRVCLYAKTANRPSQQWLLKRVGSHVMILNRNSGLAISDNFNSTPSVQNILCFAPDSTDERQLWNLSSMGHAGYYIIKNQATQRIIANRNGVTTNNNPLISVAYEEDSAIPAANLWAISLDELIQPEPDAIREEQLVDYALRYNPNTNELHFIAPQIDALTFDARVYAANGRLVGSFKGNESFDGSSLPQGIYLVSWTFANKNHQTKFVKK